MKINHNESASIVKFYSTLGSIARNRKVFRFITVVGFNGSIQKVFYWEF
jgi:hypothetical protein